MQTIKEFLSEGKVSVKAPTTVAGLSSIASDIHATDIKIVELKNRREALFELFEFPDVLFGKVIQKVNRHKFSNYKFDGSIVKDAIKFTVLGKTYALKVFPNKSNITYSYFRLISAAGTVDIPLVGTPRVDLSVELIKRIDAILNNA